MAKRDYTLQMILPRVILILLLMSLFVHYLMDAAPSSYELNTSLANETIQGNRSFLAASSLNHLLHFVYVLVAMTMIGTFTNLTFKLGFNPSLREFFSNPPQDRPPITLN